MADCRAVTSFAAYSRNAAAMWTALTGDTGEVLARSERVLAIWPSRYHTLRAVVLDSGTDPERTIQDVVTAVLPRAEANRRLIEDPSGGLDLAPYGFTERFRFPVMVREPGPVPELGRVEREVSAIAVPDAEQLAVAEHVMAAVFTPALLEPEMRGLTHPPRLLGVPGWEVWLAHRADVPAGAAYTFDDGATVGVYQVTTLPEHRGNGVARAMMATILDRYHDRPVTLTATEQGRGLYEQLGFVTVAEARWWVPEPDGGPNG